MRAARPGDLDTLELAARDRVEPGPGQVEIEIHAASLNYVDALNAMGVYSTVDDVPPPLGADCAGVVARVGADRGDPQPLGQLGDEGVGPRRHLRLLDGARQGFDGAGHASTLAPSVRHDAPMSFTRPPAFTTRPTLEGTVGMAASTCLLYTSPSPRDS